MILLQNLVNFYLLIALTILLIALVILLIDLAIAKIKLGPTGLFNPATEIWLVMVDGHACNIQL